MLKDNTAISFEDKNIYNFQADTAMFPAKNKPDLF